MDNFENFFRNPNEIYHLGSKIPPETLDNDCILGIDEAGRGPVLGPMVYGAAFCPASFNLNEDKYQDSKTLTESERSEMFEKINSESSVGWFATILSPIIISNSMLKRSKYNLNALSHDTAIALIRKCLESGIQLKQVYLDTVGPADKYQEKLQKIFPDIKIKVSNKADSIYKIVSVASICAKVTRDHMIKNWKFIENFPYNQEEYGSGYPSDPKTKDFLKQAFDPLFGFPTFVRFSWSTITKIMDDKAISCSWEDDEDENEAGQNGSVYGYFKSANKKNPPLKESSFFIDRDIVQLKNIGDIF